MEDEVLTLENARGEKIFISCKGGPIYNQNEEIIAGIFSFMNVSERVHSRKELADYALRLEQSNKNLEAFAYAASHDLKEPLRKIQAFGQILKENYELALGEEGLGLLGRMEGAAVRMDKMIDDLLTYSRVSSLPPVLAPVDLNAAVREALSMLEPRLTSTGGRVELEALPVVQADQVQMVQLFQNLIANALKFHRQGVPPVVRIYASPAASARDRFVQVRIEDNGIGFSMEHLEQIFLPFQRLHGRSQYEGSGIGLAICSSIVQRHSGKLTANSTPGQGSTFIVELPRPAQ